MLCGCWTGSLVYCVGRGRGGKERGDGEGRVRERKEEGRERVRKEKEGGRKEKNTYVQGKRDCKGERGSSVLATFSPWVIYNWTVTPSDTPPT